MVKSAKRGSCSSGNLAAQRSYLTAKRVGAAAAGKSSTRRDFICRQHPSHRRMHRAGQLFGDDCAQPDAANGEPVFGIGGTRQPIQDEDFIQTDALESGWALAG